MDHVALWWGGRRSAWRLFPGLGKLGLEYKIKYAGRFTSKSKIRSCIVCVCVPITSDSESVMWSMIAVTQLFPKTDARQAAARVVELLYTSSNSNHNHLVSSTVGWRNLGKTIFCNGVRVRFWSWVKTPNCGACSLGSFDHSCCSRFCNVDLSAIEELQETHTTKVCASISAWHQYSDSSGLIIGW